MVTFENKSRLICSSYFFFFYVFNIIARRSYLLLIRAVPFGTLSTKSDFPKAF